MARRTEKLCVRFALRCGLATPCPRVEQRKDSAEHWTGFNGVPAEVLTQYGHDTDGGCRITLPDGAVHKEYYAGSAGVPPAPAWQNGLSLETRSYATIADANSNAWQKRTTTAWTQDNPNVNYKTNPRVTETNVYDSSGNHRRTTIDYGAVNLGYVQWGLPHIVREYGVNGSTATEFRRTQTDYNLTQAYLDQRIIGLVSSSKLYDSIAGQWQAKTRYEYDTTAIDAQATAATMHDQNYNSSFSDRGNVTSVSRWDVTDIDNASIALTSTMSYNAAGSVLATTDPAGHTTTIDYADSFSDGNNARNTYAYPTVIKDPDWNASTAPNNRSLVQYNFDFGAKTRIEGPPPENQPNGLIQTFTYDSAARLQQVTTANTGAYTHYVYGPDHVKSYSSVNNIATNYWQSDLYSVTVFDGVGRAFTTTTNHPGSAGGYKLVNVIFDKMGRPFRQSNPTEVNSSWLPAGDDAYNPATGEGGVRYSVIDFDWQGRTTRKTHSDGAYTEASYAGCGCAGGEVVTLTDEVNRQQKVYSDVLGRNWKTEVMTWPDANNNRSVYSATVGVYNARDQVLIANQYAGSAPAEASSTNTEVSCSSGTCQKTSLSYDGYGRLQSKHVPEQNTGTATLYAYNADDTIQSVTDARGASATYGYNNNRHLVNEINYSAPSGITPTSNVTFEYDAAGNRTSMTDGLGGQSYIYDSLSRMTSETRTLTGEGNYTIGYQYNFANQLSDITNPFNQTVSYTRDASGRLRNISGTPSATYASNIQYRAWGAIKHMNNGDGTVLNASFNSRMLATAFTVTGKISKTYDYYADGRLRFSSDVLDHRFDRYYGFDHVGRLTEAFSGAEARFEPPTSNSPYQQTYGYDAMEHLTSRTVKQWSTGANSLSHEYVNNRRVGWQYDADGRMVGSVHNTYDAAGRHVYLETSNPLGSGGFTYDGNGQLIKSEETAWNEETQAYVTQTAYFVRSSVLGGQVLTEVSGGPRSFVYAGLAVLASRNHDYGSTFVQFEHKDPSGASVRMTSGLEQELDPTGADAGTYAQSFIPDEGAFAPQGSSYNLADPTMTYTIDGIRVPLDFFIARMGRVARDPFELLAVTSASSNRPVGYRNSGVKWGRKFEVIYDANWNVTSQVEWGFDETLAQVSHGNISTVYGSSSWSQLASLLVTPQNPVPRPRPDPTDGSRGLVGDEHRVSNAAIDAALKRLIGSCYDFIKANSAYDPLKVLSDLRHGGIRYRHRKNLAGEIKTGGLGSADTIFLTNNFFNPDRTYFFLEGSNVVLDKFGFQIETILHELRHALIGRHPTGGSSDDYNRGIRENCFKNGGGQ